MIMHQLDARTRKMLEDLQGMFFRAARPVEVFVKVEEDGTRTPVENGFTWGASEWEDYTLEFDVPETEEGYGWYLYLTTGREGQWDATNPQFLATLNGRIEQAFDTNHTRMPVKAGKNTVDLHGYCPKQPEGAVMPYLRASLKELDLNAEQLFYDIKVPYEAAMLLPSDNRERETTLEALSRAMDLLDLRQPHNASFKESVQAARDYLQKEYYEPRKGMTPIAVAESVGHTHIDVAWLWDLYQTRHKAVRSFSTVLHLMERYPEYKFMSSQPALYHFVKQDAPEVFERIRQRVAEGRWECEGGMWVEADCNLSGGEALARQFLYGQKFFGENFGKRCRILWLPDVFGYSAALPQLMKLSGIDYFMTTKLSWSEYNLTPYDTFTWKGIDGSTVLTHFSPSRNYWEAGHGEGHEGLTHYTTYNANIEPNQIAGGWKRFQQKALDDHFLVSYGFGDGGGGPTDWMLEQGRRMTVPLPATPVVEQSHARPFFEALEKRVSGDPRLPVWDGELYLEYHRGTYTAQGHNKRNNRKVELAMRALELRSVQANVWPKEDLDDLWHDILTLQFHDILPGSSIRKVYQDSDEMYAAAFEKIAQLMAQAEETTQNAAEHALTVYNDLSFKRDDIICFEADGVQALIAPDGEKLPVQMVDGKCVAFVKGLTPMAATTFSMSKVGVDAPSVHMDQFGFETPYYSGKFDAGMRIVSLIDKRTGRQLCREGQKLNRIVCYENRPHNYDAWDVNIYYNRRSWEVDNVVSVEPLGEGAVCAGLRVTYQYVNSTIVQDVMVYADSPRIDFRTKVNWQEPKYMLKAHFPVDVFHNEATCDIQYGNVRRATHKNTSWDCARFEVCAHKWIDVSEARYGAALLNDCKYGHSVSDDDLALTLLKSSTHPDELADIGDHEFNYALLPHTGGWREGDVVNAAYSFNAPAETAVGMGAANEKALFDLDGEGIVIEAVKRAEDGDGIIVRMYECFGARACASLTPGFDWSRAEVCNILEEKQADANICGEQIALEFKPYQIISLRIR